MSDRDRWRRAALLKDRTRGAIKERIKAGDSALSLAREYRVPVAFVRALMAWQLFPERGR